MLNKKTITVPMNRVEGDLEIQVEIQDGQVTDAWCKGTMFRGIETILQGRGAMDGLVLTPRICGICGTSHLTAAVRALEHISGINPMESALHVRNAALKMEHIQSDIRQSLLMFAVDFANPFYKSLPLFEEAVSRYEPFKGKRVISALIETKKVLEAFAILGGQWPHSSFMVPGGIVSIPGQSDLDQCQLLLNQFQKWYEQQILGCSVEEWDSIKSETDLWAWLDASEKHQQSDLGFFLRFSKAIQLGKIGRSHDQFISFGAFSESSGTTAGHVVNGAGIAWGLETESLDQTQISEEVSYSWYRDYEGGKHPFLGETRPYATGNESKKYSWAKAPRYNKRPVETGPLAEMVIKKGPLFVSLMENNGASALIRQLARYVRPAAMLPMVRATLEKIKGGGRFYEHTKSIPDGEGFGLVDAARGALGHWVKIKNEKIQHYQIITPTAWNASPRDISGTRGPIEQALIGTVVKDVINPIECGHIVRSFDPCLVCTVHLVEKNRTLSKISLRF